MAMGLRTLIPLSLTLIILAVVPVSNARASSDSDKAEIAAMNQQIIEGFNKRDPSAIMAFYSDDPDAVFFEDTIPLQMNKAALSQANGVLKSLPDFHARMEDMKMVTSGDLAVMRCIITGKWIDSKGIMHLQISRYTQIDRKEGGKWLVWHEHFSVPFDPATGKAVMNAKP
jgi:PhnB protein